MLFPQVDDVTKEPANAKAGELTDADAISATEPSAEAVLPQGNVEAMVK